MRGLALSLLTGTHASAVSMDPGCSHRPVVHPPDLERSHSLGGTRGVMWRMERTVKCGEGRKGPHLSCFVCDHLFVFNDFMLRFWESGKFFFM